MGRSCNQSPQIYQGQIKVRLQGLRRDLARRNEERKAGPFAYGLYQKIILLNFHKLTEAKEMWMPSKSDCLLSHFEIHREVVSTEDLEQLDEFDLEEMDLKWQVAMISMRMKKFYKKTGRKLQFDAKEPIGFDKTKLECYNCHKTGHFARECRTKGNQDSRRKDAWNSGNKDGRRFSKQEDSKALVTINGEEIYWKIITWRLYEACGVCILELEDGIVIHMLAERRYPLSKDLLQRMLDLGLEVERESIVALDLIRFIKKQIDEE
ncbi:ribonuclease H-like domain-containing protein [Tanacetum coccineum]